MVCAGITYSIANGRIQIAYVAADGTRGASWSDPYTFEDIYDTDVANGWGYVVKQGRQYSLTKGIWSSSATTYISWSDVSVVWTVFPADTYCLRTWSRIKIDRCEFDITASGLSKFESYDFYENGSITRTLFRRFYYFIGTKTVYDDCTFDTVALLYLYIDTVYQNCYAYGCLSLWIRGSGTITNMTLNEFTDGLFLDSRNDLGTVTIRNIKLIDSVLRDFFLRFGNFNPRFYLVDCVADLDSKIVNAPTPGTTGSMGIYLQSAFRGSIENGNGAVLTIEDKDGNAVHTETLSSENITEEEITFDSQYYENTAGVLTVNQRTTLQPFTVKVSKTGYQDLEIPDITVTSGQPTIIRGALREPDPPVIVEVPVNVEVPVYYQRDISGNVEESRIICEVKPVNIKGVVK